MYPRPTDLGDALSALRSRSFTVLAGGTDFYPARVGRPIDEDVLDISAVRALRGVQAAPGGVRIGALTTWSDLIAQPLPPVFAGLQLAAREIGGIQIQNAGTIGGNICNASPAADGVPALLALDAQIELTALDSTRRVPLDGFIIGSRRTQCRPDELVTGVWIPAWRGAARSTFVKLGARRYLVISIVMVAITIEPDADHRIGRITIAVGSCSEVATRLRELELKLTGRSLTPALADHVRAADVRALMPLTDVRGSASYRLDAAVTLIKRGLGELAREQAPVNKLR
jgi:CO/xanthine dehydrogenase FAD-binding subunit